MEQKFSLAKTVEDKIVSVSSVKVYSSSGLVNWQRLKTSSDMVSWPHRRS